MHREKDSFEFLVLSFELRTPSQTALFCPVVNSIQKTHHSKLSALRCYAISTRDRRSFQFRDTCSSTRAPCSPFSRRRRARADRRGGGASRRLLLFYR